MSLLGPWSLAYPVAFHSGGDTTREAFGKHIQEIERIYGILNALDAGKVSSSDVNQAINNALNNYSPNLTFADISGNLDASRVYGNLTNATIDASKVYGTLTNAYIDASHVNGLINYINDNLDISDKGDGIKKVKFRSPGYAKFNNGLLIQWGEEFVDTIEEKTYTINFGEAFDTICLNVTVGTRMSEFSKVVNVVPQVVKRTTTDFTFGIQFFSATAGEIGGFTGQYGVSYIAIGF